VSDVVARLNLPLAARLEIAGAVFWWLGTWGYTLLLALGLSLGGMLDPNGPAVYSVMAAGGVAGLTPLILLGYWKTRRNSRTVGALTWPRIIFRASMILAIPGAFIYMALRLATDLLRRR
jgi:hypothetical protein